MMNSPLYMIFAAFVIGVVVTLGVQALLNWPEDGPISAAVPDSVAETEEISSPPPIGKTPGTTKESPVLTANAEKAEKANEAANAEAHEERQQQLFQRMRDRMRERASEQSRIRLEYLTAELGLSPEQVAEIQAVLDQEGNEYPAALGGSDGLRALIRMQGGDPMENVLAKVLMPDQEETYAALQEKERAHNIEARTMQRFAALPETLNLSDEQKDQIYEVFAQEEMEQLDNLAVRGSKSTAVINDRVVESMTINAGQTVTGETMMRVTGSDERQDGEAPPDMESAFARMREARKEQNERQLERVAPILTERQLGVYRAHLDQRSAGMFMDAPIVRGTRVEVQRAE